MLASRTVSALTRGLVRGLVRAWLLVVPLVVALSLVRLGQLWHYWPQGFTAGGQDVAAVLFQGLRFDLKVSAIAGFLLLLVLPWISGRAHGRVVAVLVFVYLLLSVINLHYFGFYKTPIDALIFGLAEDDTVAVLATVWRDFPVIGSVLLIAALTAGAVGLHRWLLRRLNPDQVLHSRHWALRWAFVIVALFALMLAGKGTLRQMALQRQHLTVTPSQFLNDMVPNGVIALKYAWDSRGESQDLQNPLLGLQAMGYHTPLMAAHALGIQASDDASLLKALTEHPPLPAGTPKKNLVFFLMESWSAEPLRYQSPQFDVMGRMQPTLGKACFFRNFDSANGGTHPTLEALLFSSPITPLTLGEAGRKPMPWALPRVAKDAGYQTLFVTSARSGWRDLNRVLAVQGFDEVIDANHLKADYPEASLGIWGVWDHYVFRYLEKRLAAQDPAKPLFVFVLTSTNHPPYDLPADYQRVPRDMALWQGERSADTLTLNLDTYHYATDLLGAFVQKVQASAQGASTVIAASGDHNVRSFGVYATAQRRYLLRQVPFIIWGPNLQCGTQQDLPASHRDMFPTLFPLVGIDGAYTNTGRNLLQPPVPNDPLRAPRALFYTGEARSAQGMWQLGNPGSFVCTPPTDGQPCAFNRDDDAQERARYGLLDWKIRYSLKK